MSLGFIMGGGAASSAARGASLASEFFPTPVLQAILQAITAEYSSCAAEDMG